MNRANRPPSRRRRAREPGAASRRQRHGEPGLVVSVSDGRGRSVQDAGLSRWLASVAPARARGEVGIALVTDAHIRRLNTRYRRKNVATDVLSFPGGDTLGDIVIATGVARRQAREAGHSYSTELRVLALHGLLHLLGYDHEDPKDGGRMARVEARLRSKGHLRVGLIERSSVAPVVRPATRT